MSTEKKEMEHCSQCEMLSINGIACHETGCPEEWKSMKNKCFECGFTFQPLVRRQKYCSEECLSIGLGFYKAEEQLEAEQGA